MTKRRMRRRAHRSVLAWLRERVELSRWALLLTVGGLLAIIGVLFLSQRRASARVDLDAVPAFPESARALATMTGGELVEGNAVRVAENGAFFDELERDVAAATKHVHLETYIWAKGDVSDRVGRALIDAARRGVKVRVVMDAIGGHDSVKVLDDLRAAGGTIVQYRPLGLSTWQAQNYRDHRKLVVIDGRVGWIMGHGFADEWSGNGEDADHWRDTALRIEGPVLPLLQAQFAKAWLSASGQAFMQPDIGQPQPRAGDAAIHVVSSSSGERASEVAIMFEAAIRASRRDLVVATPYFTPSDRIIDAMCAASKRGVRVRLLVPGDPNDSHWVRHATHAELRRLLDAGVRVWEQDHTMTHQKIVVVDGEWSHVGSTNMDMRSLEMSEELSCGVLDPPLAAELEAHFESDLASAHELTKDWLASRSLPHRALDWALLLARVQL